jgi:hypothetical protein
LILRKENVEIGTKQRHRTDNIKGKGRYDRNKKERHNKGEI